MQHIPTNIVLPKARTPEERSKLKEDSNNVLDMITAYYIRLGFSKPVDIGITSSIYGYSYGYNYRYFTIKNTNYMLMANLYHDHADIECDIFYKLHNKIFYYTELFDLLIPISLELLLNDKNINSDIILYNLNLFRESPSFRMHDFPNLFPQVICS